jgi:hypothetical protein
VPLRSKSQRSGRQTSALAGLVYTAEEVCRKSWKRRRRRRREEEEEEEEDKAKAMNEVDAARDRATLASVRHDDDRRRRREEELGRRRKGIRVARLTKLP